MKATNLKAIEEMPWTNECVISDMNREEDGKARIWFKKDGKSHSSVAANYSYSFHYDIPVCRGDEIAPMCGTADCVNFLHLTLEPKLFVDFKEKHREKRKKSKYGGVYHVKNRDKYRAQIMVNGERKSLGMFNTEEEAQAAIDNYRKENNLV